MADDKLMITDQDVQVALVPERVSPSERVMSIVERAAFDPSFDVEKLRSLYAFHKEVKRDQDEQEFNQALSKVQATIGRIAPDLTNPQTRSKYASYAAIDRVIRPLYTAEGLSLSFDSDSSPFGPEWVRFYCYVSRGGYTRKYTKDMPADGKGAKGGEVMTKTHAAGAADSYAKRYLVKDIFNIAIGEDDLDGVLVTEQVRDYLDNIKQASPEQLYSAFKEAFAAAKDFKEKTLYVEAYENAKKPKVTR